MTQLVPRTFSPSSLRMTRSTPCVDGCCGPMLMTSSVESKNVASGIRGSLSAFDTQVLPNPALVLPKNRIILSQRVALPLLGHEYPLHVRVPGELDAEHIEHLAFQPVGRQVDAHGGLGLEAVGDVGLDPHPLVARETVNHVDQIEALGPLGPVHRRNVHQIIEVRFELEVLQHRDGAVGRGHDEILPKVGGGLLDRKSTRLNSSHLGISYAVFCLKKKTNKPKTVPAPAAPSPPALLPPTPPRYSTADHGGA